eukprot:m.164696 g.164696  ORF g.164696 m.164696 type:complete len:664 (+) comp31351_c1_seq2:173-2164(+)
MSSCVPKMLQLRVLRSAILFVICGTFKHTEAVNFYVSFSTGNDSNSGKSPDSPWKTLNHASMKVQLNNVSDALLLRRGDNWIIETGDALVLYNATGVVSSYGNDTGQVRSQPLIQVSSRGSWAACVRLWDPTQLTVTGLRLAGCGAGVLVTQTVSQTQDIAIINNVFADIRGPMQKFLPAGSSPPNPWAQDWGVAVALAQLNTSYGQPCQTNNLTVANNVGVRLDQFYTNFQPGPGWNDGPHNQRMSLKVVGAAIRGNTVQACGYNCYEMGATTHTIISDNVFLRDTPPDYFIYGTTDIILGNVDGTSAIINNDFNRRGEYEGGPDGCAIDFETSASGVVVEGNTIFKSWGAGIMVFGHQTTSHNLSISNNVFLQAGCVQTAGDHAAIAFMCPNGAKASGKLDNNLFQTCTGEGVVSQAYNEAFPGCMSNWSKMGNLIDSQDPSARVVSEPILRVPPTPNFKTALIASATSTTPNVTFHYTLDGSRPTEESPLLTPSGVTLPWPGPVVAVNFRGFKKGFRPSITNGVVLELNYNWPDPGAPPPPPAPGACPGYPDVRCDAAKCPPSSISLTCPRGQRVDYVFADGDDGSCDCVEFCASNWDKTIKMQRPTWTGATSAFPRGVASQCCVCVQATHWCNTTTTPCSATCNSTGTPSPISYCVPIV